ncbi:MAG TPA: OmpA family protein, partial [Flavitalea sp.]|nr:OmpA family protein [Flavitalea sp.]
MGLAARFLTCITVMPCISFSGNSQVLKSLGNRVKQKVNQRVNQKTDEAIDKGLDKAENAGKDAGKTKDSTINPDNNKSNKSNNSSNNSIADKNTNATNNPSTTADEPAFQVYSKFDFIPGEKIIAYDDFSKDAIGDFPVTWNTNSSGEVVTFSSHPGHWLMVKKQGRFIPENIKDLPDNFTFEYDVICNDQFSFYSPALSLLFLSGNNSKGVFDYSFIPLEKRSGVKIGVHPTNGSSNGGIAYAENFEDGTGVIKNQISTAQFNSVKGKTKLHVSVWRQKQRIRVYLNEEKVYDLPRAFPAGKTYNTVLFEIWNEMHNDNDRYLIGNLKLSAGAPDTRSKLITEGKFVTRGILFDVNSDKIKPESYGALKDIAGVLSENASVKVKIVGHTDADGSDADNLTLSKRRAESVKNSLVKDFGIDASRLETDGKGES